MTAGTVLEWAGLAGQGGRHAEDLSGAEYIADDDRAAARGGGALPRRGFAPAIRVRAEQVRRVLRPSADHDAA